MNMFGQKTIGNAAVAILLVSMIGSARADVFNMSGGTTSLEFITVANPGNVGQLVHGLIGIDPPPSRVCGEVDYVYSIGKYEVTAGQYCEFLNAVAKTDTHGLYNPYMDLSAYPSNKGCNIIRTGTSGNYSYSVTLDWANRPVNYVSWNDSARFVNWLTNDQPTGSQNNSTTEAGAYNFLTGQWNHTKYALPSEDEWYKAAYYDPNKPGGAGYWKYATKSDTVVPSNILSSTGVNNANYASTSLPYGSIGSPYYRTPVGAFAGSPSAYGTFDQAGNVSEWNEAWFMGTETGDNMGFLGAGFWDSDPIYWMSSSYRSLVSPSLEDCQGGFRVVFVPEPSGITLFFAGIVTFILFFRRH
jgi:sulfatase modifying factor 1